jgi:hypothetical protein
MKDLQSRAERVRCLGTIINVHFLVIPLSRPGEEWAGGCRAIGAPLAAGDIFFQKDYLRVSGLAYCVRELAIHFYPNYERENRLCRRRAHGFEHGATIEGMRLHDFGGLRP